MKLFFNLFNQFLVLSFLLTGLACSKKTEDPKVISASQRKLESLSIYPHSEGFKTSREHGQYYITNSKDCATCHSTDATSTSGIKGATSCVSCHKVFPHTEEFKKSQKHGAKYLEDGQTCVTCHNKKEVQTKTTGATSCVSCHADYPHDTEFTTTHNHGLKFYENSKQCSLCHKDPVAGQPAKATSCVSCHKIYPHTSEFKFTNAHGTTFYDNKVECKKCHKTENEGVQNAPKNCSSCHKGFPHTEDFKTSSIHGSEYLKDKSNCTKCHGTDFKGGNLKVSCLDCHSFPHTGAWALPTNHGASFKAGKDMVDCQNCHSEKSEFKKRHPEQFVVCNTCHIQLPHSEGFKNGEDTHPEQARSYNGKCYACHSDGTRNLPNTGSCTACHGDDQIPQVKWVPKPAQVKFKAK